MKVSIGDRYNMLTVIDVSSETDRRGKNKWVCLCDCGNKKVISTESLLYSHTKSCGCIQKEWTRGLAEKVLKTHGLSKTRLHHEWRHIKNRCNNPKAKKYPIYGGRGIKLCAEWDNDFQSFYDWSMANGYKDNLTIDRIDVDKGYEPSNCRWIPLEKQSDNKRNTIRLTYNGRTQTLTEWCNELNLNRGTARSRYVKGNTPAQILGFEPVNRSANAKTEKA